MEEVLKLLDSKNIKYDIIYHDEVHTIEDMDKLGLLDKGYICKNLFLRDQKGKNHFVVSCLHSKTINLEQLAQKIGSSKLSFGSEERLDKYLKLKNGYVSPFGVINDDSKTVIFVFDKDLVGQTRVGFHPNTNKATVFVSFNDIKKIILDHGNDLLIIKI